MLHSNSCSFQNSRRMGFFGQLFFTFTNVRIIRISRPPRVYHAGSKNRYHQLFAIKLLFLAKLEADGNLYFRFKMFFLNGRRGW